MKGSEVRSLRRRLKLTQESFADRLGVSKTTVARWEIDQVRPSPLALARLSDLKKYARKTNRTG